MDVLSGHRVRSTYVIPFHLLLYLYTLCSQFSFLVCPCLSITFLVSLCFSSSFASCIRILWIVVWDYRIKCFISVFDPVCNASMNPAIDDTVESDDLWAWCTVTYVGKGIPWMKWTIDGTRHVTPNTQTVDTIGAVSTFTSRINMQVSSSHNSMMAIFKIIFELRELPEHAHHGPTLSYEFTWKQTVNSSCKYATNQIIS